MKNNILLYSPAVFAVGDNYAVFARVAAACEFAVEINGKRYYDNSNGVIRTSTKIHKVYLPQSELNNAKHYKIIIIPVIARRAYFSKLGKEIVYDYDFFPLPDNEINIYQIADTHGRHEHAVKSAENFNKKIDLLVLNGDIIDSSDKVSEFETIYRLTDMITHGNIPVICTRGNHDLRGKAAELLSDYMPTENGNTYYSVKLGNIWFLVLDCGEDKDDFHKEYGGTVCCHDFRIKETEYIKSIIDNAAAQYDSPDIKHKIVIAHKPFTIIDEPPFDIEQDIYGEWVNLLSEYINPDLVLAGHIHRCFISYPGDKYDSFGQSCPVIVGSMPKKNESFTGCGITLSDYKPEISFIKG